MRTQLFLLLYLLAHCWGTSGVRNGTCVTHDTCVQVPDPTSHFLQCVGLPSTDTGKDHMLRLKGIIEATLDVYTFMRSSMEGVPFLDLQAALELNPNAEALQDQALVQMWLKVKVQPLLRSITKHFLSCLSTKNFSCATYQTVVKELSFHFSDMDPARQKWIYMFFMYPFLSGERVAGCVKPEEGSEDWLKRNFGAFSVMARMKDFSALNMVFSGLEVLHLLSPEQKAELLLRPEVAGLENGTLSLVFHSMMSTGSGPRPTNNPGESHNWTTPGYPLAYTHGPTYNPYLPPSPQDSLRETVNGFMGVFKPIGSFVREFVTLTHKVNVSEMRSATLTQALLNWTLAELANIYRPHNESSASQMEGFDVTDVEDWYHHVVMPVLQRFLTDEQTHIPENIKFAFHHVFYLDYGMGNDTSETQDNCSITLDEKSCGLTNAVENVAHVLHCAARSNLTLSEETFLRMVVELTGRLNSLVLELSTMNFSEVASHFKEVFGQIDPPSLTQENLEDPEFIKLWFQIKLLPLLPEIPTSLLSCLSMKNFTCPVYQALVAKLSEHLEVMDRDHIYSRKIYKHFIHSFLLHHNTSDPHCLSTSNHSADWLEKNFGFFSMFAPLTDFYDLNPNFSGLEALRLLSPKQSAELVTLPLHTDLEREVIINRVFDHLIESPRDRKFTEFLSHLVVFSGEGNISCSSYKLIFTRLDQALPVVPHDVASAITHSKLNLSKQVPADCIIYGGECHVTPINETDICATVNSTRLQQHLDNGMMNGHFCHFGVEEYACASLSLLKAEDLAAVLKCNHSSSGSRPAWKLFLSKASKVMDAALDLLANTTLDLSHPAMSLVLDSIGEIRFDTFTMENFQDPAFIKLWFNHRLRLFLPAVSKHFLSCLSTKNLSCTTYQTIVQSLSRHQSSIELSRQVFVYTHFIKVFLSRNYTADLQCFSTTNHSAEWLQKYFGFFSMFASVRDFYQLNPNFSGLEALRLLSPKQSAEHVTLPLHTDPEREIIINRVFDHLTESPRDRKFPDFLLHLVLFAGEGNISCSSYKTLFARLDQALLVVPHDMASAITRSKMDLSKQVPPGCITSSGECHITPINVTHICTGVNSTRLQQHLDNGTMNGHFCHFGIEEYACASLSLLKAEDLAAVLKCNWSSSGSRPAWKLFLSKASAVMDAALDLLANTTFDVGYPARSLVLDSVAEIRFDTFTLENFQDPAFIKLWFNHRLRLFLPAVSKHFLSCLSTKNLSCSTYQTIVQSLSRHQSNMELSRQMSVYTHFIKVFLNRNYTADPQCLSTTNHSADWLQKNFGFFSVFASVRDFYHLNPNFSGLEALRLLSPKQSAEHVTLPLHTDPEREIIINRVFDHLTESPRDRKFPDFLLHLVLFAGEGNISCSSYKTLFARLDQALLVVPHDMASAITRSKMNLSEQVPPGCITSSGECHITPINVTHICTGVNSTRLQQHLDSGTMNGHFCHFGIEEYACASLSLLKAEDLAAVLKCNQASSGSRPAWKLFLSKASAVMNAALDLLANTTLELSHPAMSLVLDSIAEIRFDTFTVENFQDPAFIKLWFNHRLRLFLPAVSQHFLSCLSAKNLSCSTYQTIVQSLSHHQSNMELSRQKSVYTHFIKVFLNRNYTADPQCLSTTNHSADWLQKNFGFFSVFASVRDFYHLNPNFSGLEALRLLSPKQSAELVTLPLHTDPEREVIINRVFDHLIESPRDRKFTDFLPHLVVFSGEGNISCSSYKTIFTRLDQALLVVPRNMVSAITRSKTDLSEQLPPGCVIYSGECHVTPTNVTDICAGVNSTRLQQHLDNGTMNRHFCHFGVEEYACASLSLLKAEDLAAVLKCNWSSSGSRPAWKLFLSKASAVMDAALDLLANTTLDLNHPAMSLVLDSVGEIRFDTFTMENFQDPAFIKLWFNHRLRLFLPAVSKAFLSCLSTKNLSCSTYQAIVQSLSRHQSNMELSRQLSVYTHFIKVFLSRDDTGEPRCRSHNQSSGEWLEANFRGFSALVSFHDLQELYSKFSALEALPHLTVRQLAEVSSTPGQLTSPGQVGMVMAHVPNQHFTAFFDYFSPAIMGRENVLLSEVRSAMLQVVFDRANLSEPSVRDWEVLDWLHNRLAPLLVDLSPRHVAPFFRIIVGRNCSTEQQAVEVLNSTISTLNVTTRKEIHNSIIQSLRGLKPLRCYGDNYKLSFYRFLERRFVGFQFPNLTTFLSLMPDDKMHQLVNSMPPADLADFLNRPGIVDNDAELCAIYQNYIQTPVFLETETIPEVVRQPTLPCIWPMALSSPDKSEVNAWFDQRLPSYLGFLTKSLLTSTATQNASCQAFQKLVTVLAKHNSSSADFVDHDVFNIIKSYLTSGTLPKCYNASDPELNSTAWFAEYIGPFITFLTLEDLNTFGSAQVIQVFTVNPLNIKLLKQYTLPLNLTNYYTELLYLQDSNFNPIDLPPLFRCVAPASAFTQLTAAQSQIILRTLTTNCTDLDPQIPSALAANFGDNINVNFITALGTESSGLSTGQINMAKPEDLNASLSTLSTVPRWNQGQAMAIISSLTSSGLLKINQASSLIMLGSLVVGVPSSTFSGISGSQLLSASQNPGFLTHMLTAPTIIQQTFVTQIILVDTNSEKIIENVPDDFASEIPGALLSFTSSNSTVNRLNKKKWKREQAVLFFDTVALGFGDASILSPYILQGFTCTRVRTLSREKIKNLVKACRGKRRRTVILQETQLTCMYNYIKAEPDVTNYNIYPPDMLLYYDYSLVPQANCTSYFQEIADADFSVFSDALSYRIPILFTNARSCLGITGVELTEGNISVLGNMCCTLNGSYIQNSHSSILEKLKNCPDIDDAQVAAMESLLMTGTTRYGAPSTWDIQTLKDLGILPLYLTKSFYKHFDKKAKQKFLRYFLKKLRRDGVKKKKIRRVKKAIRQSKGKLSKRSIENECTVGQITQVTISDEAFPFDYDDINQFNICLSNKTVKDNLAAITDKVDDEDYLGIILKKLREAYAASSTIPEEKVHILGPASRVATNEDISMWKITKTDTLSALMDSSNGEWDPAMANTIITKYLSEEGNSIGSAELNLIGGANLCSLDADVLKKISQDSLRKAKALTVSNCTLEKKKVLFTIAIAAFSGNTRSADTITSYQLIKPYLGGAPVSYVRSLASSDVSMDMATFIRLDESIIMALSVDEVRGLLGTNLPTLKSYENQIVVQNWICNQYQSDLDSLALGLVACRADPTSTTGSTGTGSTVTTVSAQVTTAGSGISSTTGGSATTTGSGSTCIRPDIGLSLLVLLTCYITSKYFSQ